ncbi:PHP domain-containing protein [Candidatus Bathyarchaeota archaeon]|nr:MAG: PHP domain-containing protein [Candidatus Bathyarchaeota archaeon]
MKSEAGFPLKLKLDLHVHTNRSNDAVTSPKQLATICRDRGLDGLAITDHNVLAVDSSKEVVFLPGIEISTRDGHIIGLGLSEAVPRGLSADETIQRIKELQGVSIIPHPYDLLRSSVRPHNLAVRPDAIEVINSSSFLHSLTWKRARKFAEKQNYPMTAGSDSHIPETIGRAYTEVESPSKDTASVLAALKSGLITPVGGPIRVSERVRKMFHANREET